MKALFAAGMPPEVDHAGVAGLLAYGYAPPPDSLYKGVHQLPPAHRLVLAPGKAPEVSRYWQVSFSATRAAAQRGGGGRSASAT